MTTTPKNSGGDQKTYLSTDERIKSSLGQGGDPRMESTTSDQAARVPHPIFAIVNPPRVSSMAREALMEWLKLRKEYEEYTRDRCKDGKEEVSAVMKSVKSSFDANVLETLCEVCWGVDQSSTTDDFMLEKNHEVTDSFQNQELPDVKELFREELHMNMNNTAIDARVIEYFHLCNSLIKKHGFSGFFEEDRGIKEKCKLIINSLPKGLKSKVQNELVYRVPEAKGDIRKLYELIRVKTKEQAIEERALKKANSSHNKHQRKEHSAPTGHHQHKRREG
ncbi:cleavage induced hypothetical protein [Phytophthora infestans T30-4]|uniref:Cleavage induced protein n=1 Tax=Phytophthora infestans (strain T30-4) TaxID=403677 RepID=D0NXP2_PHYIT|nr:cleavage induced hypothetical protein [Phytophthora infestans T30-4]EEY67842.1 cleavage induced hypothetical protein [Phytophthora infestans T30-4]|eukprot:XP_002997867.1 cleavage induced hypothetical protein [Phytophthora infestans T30-4]